MPEVQGFLASLTIDGINLTQQVESTPLARSKSSLGKATMDGTPFDDQIPGKHSATLDVSGFLTTDEHNELEVTWEKDDPVLFALTVADGASTEASWSGAVVLDSFTVEPEEDGLWKFSLSGNVVGGVQYTPRVA